MGHYCNGVRYPGGRRRGTGCRLLRDKHPLPQGQRLLSSEVVDCCATLSLSIQDGLPSLSLSHSSLARTPDLTCGACILEPLAWTFGSFHGGGGRPIATSEVLPAQCLKENVRSSSYDQADAIAPGVHRIEGSDKTTGSDMPVAKCKYEKASRVRAERCLVHNVR